MQKIVFAELDSDDQRLIFRLADEAKATTPHVIAAARHIGELLEAGAFMTHFPQGSEQHRQLAECLRAGDAEAESILTCIKRIAPDYDTLGQLVASELDDFLPESSAAAMGL